MYLVNLKHNLLAIMADHRRLFRYNSFTLLWSGQTVSVFGDAFFNLAVMWVVWSETQSTLQTAIIQAVWHIPDVLFGPLAGVLADRWNRKAIMVTTNVGAAVVVGAVALIVVSIGHLPPYVAFLAIFKLNALTAFMNPARAAVMPSVVGRDLLTTAQGALLCRWGDGVVDWKCGSRAVGRSSGRGLGVGDRCRIVPVSVVMHRACSPSRERCFTHATWRDTSQDFPKVACPGTVRWMARCVRDACSSCPDLARSAHQYCVVYGALVACSRTGALGWRGRFTRSNHGGRRCGRHCLQACSPVLWNGA